MDVQFTEQHLENIKEVLFGNQKQANVTNEAVVKLVARELSVAIGLTDSAGHADIDAAIMKYLEGAITATVQFTDDVLMLIAGEQSIANRNSGQPCQAYHRQPSEQSPKMMYRIVTFGENADIDNTGEVGGNNSFSPTPVSTVNKTVENADFYTQARQLRDAILPTVPDAVKAEIPDNEWAQCLVCAKGYFDYHG